jgi:hypothetical protein
MLPPHPGTANQ